MSSDTGLKPVTASFVWAFCDLAAAAADELWREQR
jgi:hypothetical protein